MIGVDHNKLAGFVDYEHIHEDGLIGLVPMFLRNPFTQVGTNWTGMSFGEVDFGSGAANTVYMLAASSPIYSVGFTYIVEFDTGWTGPSDLYLKTNEWRFGPGAGGTTEIAFAPTLHQGGWSCHIRMADAGAKIKSAMVCLTARTRSP
jgi:hypothetical protein